MNTIHKRHNNKIKLCFVNIYEFASELEQAGCCFISLFFKGAAVSLPNVAHTFDMTNEHPTAKLMTASPLRQLAGEGGGGQLQPPQPENNMSEHQAPFIPTWLKKKKKRITWHTNTDVTPAANANQRFVQTWKAKFIKGDLYKSTRRHMMQLGRRSRKESVLCSGITQKHTPQQKLLLGGRDIFMLTPEAGRHKPMKFRRPHAKPFANWQNMFINLTAPTPVQRKQHSEAEEHHGSGAVTTERGVSRREEADGVVDVIGPISILWGKSASSY